MMRNQSFCFRRLAFAGASPRLRAKSVALSMNMAFLFALVLWSPITWAEQTPTTVKTTEKPLDPTDPDLMDADRIPETTADPDRSVLQKTKDVVTDSNAQVQAVLGETRVRREASSYLVMGSYSPVDLLIPGKIGLTAGLTAGADKTWELEYLKGSLSVPSVINDLGSMNDERVSLIGRSYFGNNSFNFGYGITYFNFNVHIGDDLLNRAGGVYPSADLIVIQTLGVNLSLGNRWTFNRNFTLGVDWISWAQPFFMLKKQSGFEDQTNNPDDKDTVEKAIGLISYFPRFAVCKLQLGILF